MAKNNGADEKAGRFRAAKAVAHRLKRQQMPYAHHPGGQQPAESGATEEATVDCGWGRLLFAQTFRDPAQLVSSLREEAPEHRDIAIYVRDRKSTRLNSSH